MNDFYMGQLWMLPKTFEKAQREMARNFKYLDYAALAAYYTPGSSVIHAETNDGLIQKAQVVDWRDFDWKTYLIESNLCDRKQPPFGAHIPVRWIHNQESTLLSLQRIQSPPHSYNNNNNNNNNIVVDPFLGASEIDLENERKKWERKALIQSLESSGKSICNAKTKFGNSKYKLKAYWPEDGKWYSAKALDPDGVNLETLASHAQFVIPGKYCPLLYEDGEFALSPLHYVSKRREIGGIRWC